MSIRHVPEEVRDALAARAAQRGQSLQEYLLNTLIEHAERPTMAEMLKRIRARKAVTMSSVTVQDIVEDDEDRR